MVVDGQPGPEGLEEDVGLATVSVQSTLDWSFEGQIVGGRFPVS